MSDEPARVPYGQRWVGTDDPADHIASLFEALHAGSPALVAQLLSALDELGRRDPVRMIRLLSPAARPPQVAAGDAGEPVQKLSAPPATAEADPAPTHWQRPCDEGETLLQEYPEQPIWNERGERLNRLPSAFPRTSAYGRGTWRSR
jgi:hypothetical protein